MKSGFFGRVISIALFFTWIGFVSAAAQASESVKNNGGLARTFADSASAGSGKMGRITMARGTWDTGWFQAEIFKQLLEALGYSVEGPKTMENQPFYHALARGEIDLWANSWFPSQSIYFQDPQVQGKIEPVGYQVKAGALQGYLVDKKSAGHYGIRNLMDFKDPKIARRFDRDGNGKADLIGCNRGWACALEIDHHLRELGLNDTVEQIQGEYTPLMSETVDRYKKGQPVFFFTWTPNWTIGALTPGQDVVWLQVPVTDLSPEEKGIKSKTMVESVPGCGADPCAMGFMPSDIRVSANSDFLKLRPAVKRLAELVIIPLTDINDQNAKMLAGEDDDQDIHRHAKAWIHRNRVTVDQWLKNAGVELSSAEKADVSDPIIEIKGPALRVATKSLAPFVDYQNRRYIGFCIDLWEKIAQEMGVTFKLYGVNTFAKLLDEVKRHAADVAIGGIGITSTREQYLDFSHPIFTSGLQIMVSREHQTPIGAIFSRVFGILFSPELLSAVGLFLVALFMAAHVIWLMERRHNPDFSEGYLSGLWQSIWWALVTVTTVGYGDKTPRGKMGRLFGMVWILAGYFVLAYFTASVTSIVTVRELQGTINGPEDLFGKGVATVEKSPAADYLAEQGISAVELPDIDAAYDLLEAKKVDAIVYDAPVLQHHAMKKGKSSTQVVGLMFKEHSYGFALQADSPYREQINTALLRLIENGLYKEIHDRWFGS